MSIKDKIRSMRLAPLLMSLVPLVLVVPNVALCFTESMSLTASLANVLLPLGLYCLALAAWKRVGVTTLLLLPFMILDAFQIVLLYLYGGSIIAVDMFINVVTTNASEVSELLGNLLAAILLILLLYLPPLVIAVITIAKRRFLEWRFRRPLAIGGAIAAVAGSVACAMACLWTPDYRITNDLFPVNVICNIGKAVGRVSATADYPATSAAFSFHASRPAVVDSLGREVYVLVIGESSRADRWQLFGAERPTTPRLSRRSDLVAFPRAITQSNTTHKSVPMLLSHVSASNFDSIASVKSILSAFSEVGFRTLFLSNQQPNRSFTQHFSDQADCTVYLSAPVGEPRPYDLQLLDLLRSELADTTVRRLFVVLHTYGSHFTYRDRYPDEFSRFTPDRVVDASAKNRQLLLNAYDNTVLYTDFLLDSLINLLSATGARSAMLYAADHGEDIFDDSRGRFLHASPTPTYYQLHVAALAWLSDHPTFASMRSAMRRNADSFISPSVNLFHTMLQIASIQSPVFSEPASLASPRFVSPEPLYLNDHNEAVPLLRSGLRSSDLPFLQPLLP